MSGALTAFSLQQWIEDNKSAFLPPVANKEVWPESEFIFQIVRGPNSRNDFHLDPGDEIFYQLQGTIRVDVIEPSGERKTNILRQGDVLFVPAGVAHSPMRPAGTWGLVVERKRRPDELDGVLWFCEGCNSMLHEDRFNCRNIEIELKTAIEQFNANEEMRTCRQCGAILPVPGEFELR